MSKKEKKSESTKTTRVFFLLDESGSMQACKVETVSGYNKFLESLREDKGDKVKVSLTKFDSLGIKAVYTGEAIKDVKNMTMEDFKPGSFTPLLDAIGKTIRTAEEAAKKGDAVIFVILTDGQENASHEFTKEAVRALIKEKDDWKFVFLGADIDAFGDAAALGIKKVDTLQFNKADMAQAYGATALAMTSMRGAYMDLGVNALKTATFSEATQEKLLKKTK